MRISVNPILDMETLQWLPCQTYDYKGPVLRFKGDQTAQEAEAEQLGHMNQLMNIFQAQYGAQNQVLQYLQSQFAPQIAKPEGFAPQDLAAMRTQASDVAAQQATAARQAAANRVPGGGSKLAGVAGTTLQTQAAIDAAQAGAETQAQTSISLQNALQAQQNRQFAAGILSGVAQQQNPLGYSGQILSGGQAIGDLSQAYTASAGPTATQLLGGAIGGGLSALGSYLGRPTAPPKT